MMFSLSKREQDFHISRFFRYFAFQMTEQPILTITGSDSTGGSGVQADIKTISALGGYALSAITSITEQNTLGIQEFYDLPAQVVAGQMEAIINDMQPQIVKIGMVRKVEVLEVIVGALVKYKPRHVIYDPIVFSSRGDVLMSEEVVRQVRRQLLPLCTLLVQPAPKEGDSRHSPATLWGDEREAAAFTDARIVALSDAAWHGLTSMFSSAVAVFLSKGETMEEAIGHAKEYVATQTLRSQALTGRSHELYREFTEALERHIKTNNDVAFYADQLNVSSRYLAQVCRQISGKSPKAIIDELLVGEIERRLETTQQTIQEIAYNYGFSSQAHFSKFFKKMTGQTPSEFRKWRE